MRKGIRAAVGLLGLGLGAGPSAGDFASSVVAYEPAPGQFINGQVSSEGLSFSDPSAALGPPTGGSLASPDNTSLVSLGGFAGSLTLRFSQTVFDDPLNPMGLDAIVYGNAFYVAGDPSRRWAEAGVIEISLDVNGNGIADDPWYLIPGSDLPDPAAVFASVTWDADPFTAAPPAEPTWYPDPTLYPLIGPSYQTHGFMLPPEFDGPVLAVPPGGPPLIERYFGYADLTPTLPLGDTDADGLVDDFSADTALFYTVPDSPFTIGVDPGSGGGDAFDIAWAIDVATGLPARLPGFDFIRVSSGVDSVSQFFGEVSTEIDAVADVRQSEAAFDIDSDGDVDTEDLYQWHERAALADPAADVSGDFSITDADRDLVARAVRRNEPQTSEVR